MRTIILSLALLIGFAVQAQTKTEKTIADANRTKNDVESAVNFGKGIGGLFKKKKKEETDQPKKADVPATEKPAGTKTTMLIVAGLDFSKLKTLNENIKACNGVQATTMKYGEPSSIEITHTGTTEALMKLVSDVSKDIFTEKNITGFEEGRVTVKL